MPIHINGTLNFGGNAEATPAEGDLWYDSGKFNFSTNIIFAGVWSSGDNLSFARKAPTGAGTQTAALCMGGHDGFWSSVNEEYDGTSWSMGGDLRSFRIAPAGAGTQTAALCMGGDGFTIPQVDAGIYTEEYNGTSWSDGGTMGTSRLALAGAGTLLAGLCMGGDGNGSTNGGVNCDATEHYDGTSWTAGGDLALARKYLAGCGTQSAGLCFGGKTSSTSPKDETEEYDGTSWSAGGDLVTASQELAGAGTQSAAICMGGWYVFDEDNYFCAAFNGTQEYDGTSWSSGGDLSTARYLLAAAGTQTAGLCMGGYTGLYSNVTEEYNTGTGDFDQLFTANII